MACVIFPLVKVLVSIAVTTLLLTTKVKSAIVTVFISSLGFVVFKYVVPSGFCTVLSVPSNSKTLTFPLLKTEINLLLTSLLIV